MRSGTRRKHSHAVYVSCIGYSKPDGALAQKVRIGLIEVLTYESRRAGIQQPKLAKLNKKNREDRKHMIVTIYGLCVFSSHLQVIKKHLILNNAVLIDSIYYTWQ